MIAPNQEPHSMRTQIQSLTHSLRQLSASFRSLFPNLQASHTTTHIETLEEMIEANDHPQHQQQLETANRKGIVGKMLGLRKKDSLDTDAGSVLSGKTLRDGEAEASLAGLNIWSAWRGEGWQGEGGRLWAGGLDFWGDNGFVDRFVWVGLIIELIFCSLPWLHYGQYCTDTPIYYSDTCDTCCLFWRLYPERGSTPKKQW